MTSTKGWIAVDRSIMDHWLYSGKPFCCFAAFVDLLLKANYMDKKVLHRGELVLCKRGTVNLSIKELADCWGWSRPKVRTFLDKLEADGMVALEITPRRTVISIINYDKYQAAIKNTTSDKGADGSGASQNESIDDTADVTADDTTGVTANVASDVTADVNQTTQQTYTTNNYNNVNNTTRGKGNNSKHTPPSLDEVKSYCAQRGNRVNAERFYNYYSSRHWPCGKDPIDWQSKVREWETNNYDTPYNNTPHKSMEQKIQELRNYNSFLRGDET